MKEAVLGATADGWRDGPEVTTAQVCCVRSTIPFPGQTHTAVLHRLADMLGLVSNSIFTFILVSC